MDHQAVAVGLILAQDICFSIMSPILDTGLKISFRKTRRSVRSVTNNDAAQDISGDGAHPPMKGGFWQPLQVTEMDVSCCHS